MAVISVFVFLVICVLFYSGVHVQDVVSTIFLHFVFMFRW